MTTEHSPSAAGFSGRAPLRCVALNAKRPLAPTKSKRKGTRAKAAAMMTLALRRWGLMAAAAAAAAERTLIARRLIRRRL